MSIPVVEEPAPPLGDGVVGREAELAAVAGLLEPRPGPRALLFAATAGMGKTLLWKAAVEQARARRLRVLASRPSGTEVQLSFAALGDLFTGLLGEVRTLPAPQRSALEAALLLEEVDGPPPDARAIGLAVLALLRAAAAAGPILVALDDLQWVDAPSARALEFALRRLDDEPVAVLACARREDGDEPALDLGATLGADRVMRIELGPLPARQLGQLLRLRTDRRLPPGLVGRIHLVSGGNPLYALEIARVLSVERARDAPLPLPSTLRELVSGRLASLLPSARETLLAAAALTHPTVTQLEGAVDDAGCAAAALRHALEAKVVELDGERVAFTHPLLASVLYGEALPHERRALHRRLAAVTVEPEERARHLALGAEGPDENAAAVVDDAARRAAARGAPDAAAELAELSLPLTPPGSVDELLRRLRQAARFRFDAGDTAAAVTLLERALAAAPPGPTRGRILAQLGTVRGGSESIDACIDLYRRALAEARGDDALRAEIHQHLAFALQLVEVPAAEADARAALALAERVGDPGLLARSLATGATIDFQLGRGIQRAVLARAIELEKRSPRLELDHSPSLALAFQLQRAGELDEARAWFERMLARADASVALPLVSLSYVELRAGNWRRAEQCARDAWQTAIESGRQVLEGAALCAQARVAAWRGDVEPARALAAQAQAVAEATGYRRFAIDVRHLLGFLELSLGNGAAAVEHLLPALEARLEQGIVEPYLFYFLPDAVEALVANGELERAEDVLAPFEARARELDRPWALATAARGRGLIAAARGELGAAAVVLGDSFVHHRRVAEPFEAARTELALGIVLRRAHRKAAARDTLERARSAFDALGAALWVDAAQRELRRIGGRTAATTSLSETEQQIVGLVASGRTNGEVAAALHLSAKTVEWNLTKVFRKLGVRSRVELAAYAAAP